jgi:hypothetical protein
VRYRLSNPYLKCLGLEDILDFFGVWNIYRCIMSYISSLNTKLIYISYTPNTYRLKIILYSIFSVPVY